jgi:hypothetical protein
MAGVKLCCARLIALRIPNLHVSGCYQYSVEVFFQTCTAVACLWHCHSTSTRLKDVDTKYSQGPMGASKSGSSIVQARGYFLVTIVCLKDFDDHG